MDGPSWPTGLHSDDDLMEVADPYEKAMAYALNLLAAAPRPAKDVHDRLIKREYPPEVIELVMTRLTELNLLDDVAFAHAWVASRHRSKKLARPALRQELNRKGIDREIVTEALDAIDDVAEYESALALARLKAARMIGVDPATQTRRIVGALGRKGYSSGVAYRAVREVLDELRNAGLDSGED